MRLFRGLVVWAGVLAASAAHADPQPYILLDADSGRVIADSDADVLWYPASLSKLMTAYLTFAALKAGRLKLTSPVTVSKNALDQPPSKMGFVAGTVMTVDNALKMMLVKSANDIAVAVAETVGGGRESAFVASMNQTAVRLGMVSTHYNNPHGLPDPGQVTTARDLAVLAQAIWADFPEYRGYLGIPAIQAGKALLPSGNQLLERYRGTNGMKTGFICASGYNLVASATRNGRTLIAVALGGLTSHDTSERAASLLSQGFNPPLFAHPSGNALLVDFEATPAAGKAVDMRDYGVCKPTPDGEVEVAAAGEGAPTSLEPRFVLMDPVVVTTGGADARLPSAPKPAPDIPLPRLRPLPDGATTLAAGN